MGIYLGQLPPAEIARLKAELAETLIANFCYPRFFDPRTQTLRMRPVDRAKRQEVWLFLSSFDFTSWARVDLMSPDLQNHIERLLIQFVQRNRSFFGEQGRRRMSDIRMLINLCGSAVVQALRDHVSGQRQGNPAFGSPRPVMSWSASNTNKYKEPTWEQISAATMVLQQQIQELRGEAKTSTLNDGRAAGATRRSAAPIRPPILPGTSNNADASMPASASQTPAPTPIPQGGRGTTTPLQGKPSPSIRPAASMAPTSSPNATGPSVVPPVAKSGPLVSSASYTSTVTKSGPLVSPPSSIETAMTSELPLSSLKTSPSNGGSATTPSFTESGSVAVVQMRNAPPIASGQSAASVAPGQRDNAAMVVGEDDMAIFDQMRHQLLLWLRVEALKAGLEINGQGPSQLLETLRQQGRLDETRLQVVSTLLNLSNQIIKTGMVSLIDYKQALMFHLMHTRNN